MMRWLLLALSMTAFFAPPISLVQAEEKASAETTTTSQDVPYEYYVHAGGDEYPFCQVLSDYLNKIPNLPPRFAEFPYDPNLDPRFTKPDWKEVDINTHKDIIAHFYAQEEKGRQTEEQYAANLAKFTAVIDTMIAEDIKEREARLEVARFKIDNYDDQTVYRYRRTDFNKYDGAFVWWAYYVDVQYPNPWNETPNQYNRYLNLLGGNYASYDTNGKRTPPRHGYDAIIFKGTTFLIPYPMYGGNSVFWPERSGGLVFNHPSKRGAGEICGLGRRPKGAGK